MTMSDERRERLRRLAATASYVTTVQTADLADLLDDFDAMRADPVRQAAQAVVDARLLGLVAIVDAIEALAAALADPEAPQAAAPPCHAAHADDALMHLRCRLSKDHEGDHRDGACSWAAADPEALPDPERAAALEALLKAAAAWREYPRSDESTLLEAIAVLDRIDHPRPLSEEPTDG